MKGITIKETISFTEGFRQLIKNNKSEEYVYDIVKEARHIIPGNTLEIIKEQTHGEPDYIDAEKNAYDVKLVIDSEQGRLIGDTHNSLDEWIRQMIQEREEFSQLIRYRDLSEIEHTKLYGIIKDRLSSVAKNEKAILFIPFPAVVDVKGSISLQFATDFLQAIINSLLAKGLISKGHVFFIYPSNEPGEFVIRDTDYNREYAKAPEFSKYFDYSVTLET